MNNLDSDYDPHNLPIEKLRHIHRIAAKIVALYGDAYLPIFIRLSKELERVEKSMDMKSLALKVAGDYTSSSGAKN